ncbi:hypothetical protein N8G13_00220 [Mycoplasma zalophi]|uniref:hypothetical protein n=1 Tax=Mycoplasma zalophi TaxID=191287 RepID=UPI0021C7F400|nr:hypothetical protein [Mycoplasma zalophi]MCU4116894.1 hypothetical protein [Mycoplasma zalophi]
MKRNKKHRLAVAIALSISAVAATTTSFILEEIRLNNLRKKQGELWKELKTFKEKNLSNDLFLNTVVQNILDDNPVLRLFEDNFLKVQTKIENLKFTLQKFSDIVENQKKLNFYEYDKLNKEVLDYINNHLKFDEYSDIKKELESVKFETDRHVNRESTQDEIDEQVKILQEAYEKAKKDKAIKDNDIRQIAYADYEKELRKLNDFITNDLSKHDFYNSLYKEELHNRDEIIKDISFENSNVGDILEAKYELIQELEDAIEKAHKISWQELQRVYDEATKYANETLTTPDDTKIKDLLLEHSKQQYDTGMNNEDFKVVYTNINNILGYVNATKIQKQVNDAFRNNAIDYIDLAKELANDFIDSFNDGKYLDIKKYVSDILVVESQDTDLKTFDKIYESANKIIEALEAKKAEALSGYDAQKVKLNKIKDGLTDPKYESIKQEITELITKEDKVRNNPDSTTRQIVDATEALKNYEAKIENKKQAKNDINVLFKDIEDYINKHKHPEDTESIQKLQKALDKTKEVVANSNDSSNIQDQKNKLEKVFEEVKKEVNATHEKREEQKTEYDEVVEDVNDLLELINANNSKYPGLADQLTTTKAETDEVVAKKDTKSTSDQIKEAKEKLKAKLNSVENQKDKIDFDWETEVYKRKLEAVDAYKTDVLTDKYPVITQKLDETITKIQEDLKKILEDDNKSLKEKIEATKKAASGVQEALDKAKEEKEETDKNRKFREFETLKNKVNDYIDQNLANNNDFDFIKDPLKKSVTDESNLVEKDSNAALLEPKDKIEVENIQESIDKLTEIFSASKALKESKDNYDNEVKKAKAKLTEIKKPVLNKDDEELYNTLKDVLNQIEEFFKNNDNKTKENFDAKAKELSDAINKADTEYTTNKEKREKARTNLQTKIEEIKKYVQDNLQENTDGNFVTKPEHEHTVNKILKELAVAQGINDNNSSTEQNLIDALAKLNSDEKVLKASEIFDKKALEAETFATSLETDKKLLSNDSQKELIDTAKENLDSAIELQKSNKTNSNATEESINQATKDLNQALEDAKQQQLVIFQNAYDNLSKKAKSLLTELDETNVEDANKHPEYHGIYDTLKAIIDSEDPKALSTSTPKPTVEILKESLPKLQKAYDDAVLAKSKSDFDKVYNDILNIFKDDTNPDKYSEIKSAIINKLQPQKDVRINDKSVASEIDKATELLKAEIPQIDLIKQKFDEYLNKYSDVSKYNDGLDKDQTEAKKILTDTLDTYKQSNIGADNVLNPKKYQEFKEALDIAFEQAKAVETSKNNYKTEKDNIVADSEFENYPKSLEKYKAAIDKIIGEDGSLKKDLDAATTPQETKKAYDDATEALKQAKADIALNKAQEDYEKAVKNIEDFIANDLDKNVQEEQVIIDELKQVKESAGDFIEPKENDSTATVTDYNEKQKELEVALAKAKYEKAKLDAQNTSKNDLKDKYPETEKYYNDKLAEIQSELDKKLQEPGENKQKQKEAYEAAKQAIDDLNKNLEAKKQAELEKNKEAYEESLKKFNDIKDEIENIQDEAFKAELRKIMEDAQAKANNALTDPLDATKYQKAKEILDNANSLVKAKEYEKLSDDAQEFIDSVSKDSNYSDVTSNLEQVKSDKDKKSLPTVNPLPSSDDIQKSIEALQDALDEAKHKKEQKDFEKKINEDKENFINLIKDVYIADSNKESIELLSPENITKLEEKMASYINDAKSIDKNNKEELNKLIEEYNKLKEQYQQGYVDAVNYRIDKAINDKAKENFGEGIEMTNFYKPLVDFVEGLDDSSHEKLASIVRAKQADMHEQEDALKTEINNLKSKFTAEELQNNPVTLEQLNNKLVVLNQSDSAISNTFSNIKSKFEELKTQFIESYKNFVSNYYDIENSDVFTFADFVDSIEKGRNKTQESNNIKETYDSWMLSIGNENTEESLLQLYTKATQTVKSQKSFFDNYVSYAKDYYLNQVQNNSELYKKLTESLSHNVFSYSLTMYDTFGNRGFSTFGILTENDPKYDLEFQNGIYFLDTSYYLFDYKKQYALAKVLLNFVNKYKNDYPELEKIVDYIESEIVKAENEFSKNTKSSVDNSKEILDNVIKKSDEIISKSVSSGHFSEYRNEKVKEIREITKERNTISSKALTSDDKYYSGKPRFFDSNNNKLASSSVVNINDISRLINGINNLDKVEANPVEFAYALYLFENNQKGNENTIMPIDNNYNILLSSNYWIYPEDTQKNLDSYWVLDLLGGTKEKVLSSDNEAKSKQYLKNYGYYEIVTYLLQGLINYYEQEYKKKNNVDADNSYLNTDNTFKDITGKTLSPLQLAKQTLDIFGINTFKRWNGFKGFNENTQTFEYTIDSGAFKNSNHILKNEITINKTKPNDQYVSETQTSIPMGINIPDFAIYEYEGGGKLSENSIVHKTNHVIEVGEGKQVSARQWLLNSSFNIFDAYNKLLEELYNLNKSDANNKVIAVSNRQIFDNSINEEHEVDMTKWTAYTDAAVEDKFMILKKK